MTPEQKLERSIIALKAIASPIEAMQNEAEEQGCQLNGHMAVAMAKDPNYLSELAKKALIEIGEI